MLYNCNKQEIITEPESNIKTVSVSEAFNLFSQSSKTNTSSKTNNNQFAIPDLDKISQEEIINSNELLTILPAFTITGVHSRILLVKIDGEIKSVVFSMVKDETANTPEFSGMIYIHTLQKEYVNAFKVENGFLVARLKKASVSKSSKSIFSKGSHKDHDCLDFMCGEPLGEVEIITKKTKKLDFISISWSGGGDSDEGGQSWDYLGDSSGGGDTAGGQTPPAETTCEPGYVKDSNGVCVLDDILIDADFAKKFPCQSEIVEEVYGNCSSLSQLFQDIFDSNDKVNVTFSAENLNNIMLGGKTTTIVGQPLKFGIKLNSERLNTSTELDIINTVAHESVHAMLFYYYQAGGFQLTNSGSPTYSELAQGFAKHRAGFGGNHHHYMAYLVNDIAEVAYTWAIENGYKPSDFSEYDINPTDSVNGLEEFLQKLAWGGLEDTSAFNELYPKNTLKRQQIIKLIQDEILPKDSGANPKGDSPTPCN